MGGGGFFTPYQLIRCECERHLKRTTRFKSMDEFVTLEALAGRAYVKELIRSRHGDQCSRKSSRERGRGGKGRSVVVVVVLLLLLFLIAMQFSNIVVVSV